MKDHKKKILIVMPDTSLRELFATISRAEGFDVVVEAVPSQMLDIAEKEKPDLVIYDLSDGAAGIDLPLKLKEKKETAGIPIIVFSAYDQHPEHARIAEQLGVSAVLSKEISPKEFIANIKAVLEPRREEIPSLENQ